MTHSMMRRVGAALAAGLVLLSSPALAALGTPTKLLAAGASAQTVTSRGSTTSAPCANGNLAVVAFAIDSSAAGPTGMTDTAGNTWVGPSITPASASTKTYTFYSILTAGIANGDSITGTGWSTSSAKRYVWGGCVSGVDTASPLDYSTTASGTSVAVTAGTATVTIGPTAQANEVMFAFGEVSGVANTDTYTLDAGWTHIVTDQVLASSARPFLAYKIVSSTASQTYTLIDVTSSTHTITLWGMTFKEAGGSPAASPRMLLMGVGDH